MSYKNNEINDLVEILIRKGMGLNEIHSDLNTLLLLEYFKTTTKPEKDAEVFFDTANNKYKIFTDEKDITPDGFADKARAVCLAYLAKKIGNEPKKEIVEKVSNENGWSDFKNFLGGVFFWGYNAVAILTLIIFTAGFISSNSTYELVEMVNNLSWFRKLLFLVLFSTPVVSVILAMRNRYQGLGRLFTQFEIPTLFLSFIFISAFDNPIAVIKFFSMMILLVPAVAYWQSLRSEENKNYLTVTKLIVNQSLTMMTGYVALLWSFFLPPIIVLAIKQIFGRSSYSMYDVSGMIFQFMLLAAFSIPIIILLFLPHILTFVTGKMWWKSANSALEIMDKPKRNKIMMGWGAILVLLVVLMSFQGNQNNYLTMLRKVGEANTFEEKEENAKKLLGKEKEVKQLFDDAINARRRYLFTKDDDVIADGYEQAFGLSKGSADTINQLFLMWASPFVYRGETDKDGKLAQYYKYLFGEYYSYGNYTTGYMPPPFTTVKLVNRKIEAETQYGGAVAQVSIEDEFENENWNQQEVVYEFSLPQGSVVTDLRLGPELEFKGVVAPKGAARKTYEAEVNKRRDPALLEQTGPDQYRLRVFPIPAKNDMVTLSGKNQKVKFSYITALNNKGYELPKFFETRNLKPESNVVAYIDKKPTKVDANSTVITDPDKLSEKLLCEIKTPIELKTKYPNISVKMDRISQKVCGEEKFDWENVNGKKIAVLVDMSYESKKQRVTQKAYSSLGQISKIWGANEITVFRYNDQLSKGVTIKNSGDTNKLTNLINDPAYFGESDLGKALSSLTGNYDMVIAMTGTKVNSPSNTEIKNIKFPVYIVNDGGARIENSSNLRQKLIEVGGGVFYWIEDALNNYNLSYSNKENTSQSLITRFWKISLDGMSLESALKEETSDYLNYLAARTYLSNLVTNFYKNAGYADLSNLDRFNDYSKKNHIVSNQSSLIALVNETQEQNLEYNSQLGDRYQDQNTGSRWPIMPSPVTGGVIGSPLFGSRMDLSAPSISNQEIGIMPKSGGGSFSALGSGGPSITGSLGILVFLVVVIPAALLLVGSTAFLTKRLRRKN